MQSTLNTQRRSRQCVVLLLFVLLGSAATTYADDLVLLRQDADASSYYEPLTVRKTGQYALVWVVTLSGGVKRDEYLTEFDCAKSMYRQLALRVFTPPNQVVSSDAIYRKWLRIPNSTQILGLAFEKVCGGSDLTPRSSGRDHHKVPSPNVGVRAAQLNRYVAFSLPHGLWQHRRHLEE